MKNMTQEHRKLLQKQLQKKSQPSSHIQPSCNQPGEEIKTSEEDPNGEAADA